MKRILFLFCLLFGLLFPKQSVDATSSNPESIVNIKEETLLNLNEDVQVIDVKKQESKFFFITETLDENCEISLVNNSETLFSVPGAYQAHTWSDQLLYLVVGQKLYKINLTNLKFEEMEVSLSMVRQVVIQKDKLLLVGSKDGDATIVRLEESGKVLDEYRYGGDGFECLDQLLWLGETPYLIGHKDAHSLNSPFANVGNKGEIKSFLARMLPNMEIADVVYFNEGMPNERITSSFLIGNDIALYLEGEEELYFYRFDDGLSLVFYERIYAKDAKGAVGSSNNFIQVLTNNMGIMWKVAGEKAEGIIAQSGKVIASTVEKGELVVDLTQGTQVKRIRVSEYHVNFIKPFFVRRENSEIESMTNLSIESYFESLSIKVQSITPYFEKTVSGTYDVIYEVIRENGESLTFSSQIMVEDYANVMDQGVYRTGHILKFFGKATLNGEAILNGYQLTLPGTYQLTLTNANGLKKEIEFSVVSDFYQTEISPLIPSDVFIDQGESIQIPINFPNPSLVDAIKVNGIETSSFSLAEDGIIFNYTAPNSPNTTTLKFEGLILTNGDFIPLSEVIVITTRKEIPTISIEENATSHLKLTLRLNDPDQAIIDIETLVYLDEKLLTCHSSFLQDFQLELSIDPSKVYRLIMQARYEIGDGNIYFQKLLDFEGQIASKNYRLLSIDVKRLGDVIDKIDIDVFTNNSKVKINDLRIVDVNFSNTYQVKSNRLLKYISFGLTVLFLLIFGGLIYKKYRKRRRCP